MGNNKGGQVLRLGKDAVTKAYIDGQLTTLSAMADGKSQLNEQIKYGESTLSSYGAEKLTPVIAKPFSPIIGSFAGELINQWNKKLEKEGEK